MHTLQVSDVIDMKEDEMNPSILTVVLSEERGHVYQFQTTHDLAIFRSASYFARGLCQMNSVNMLSVCTCQHRRCVCLVYVVRCFISVSDAAVISTFNNRWMSFLSVSPCWEMPCHMRSRAHKYAMTFCLHVTRVAHHADHGARPLSL